MKQTMFAAIVILLVSGSFLAAKLYQHTSAAVPATTGERRILYYVDPMNPAHTSQKPGLAPCGMNMEPVYADGDYARKSARLPVTAGGTVRVSLEKQQTVGVRVAPVESAAGTRTLRTVGKVALDESRVLRVTSAIDGWVRTTTSIVSGSLVRKDEVLATYYNREFLTAQQTYFFALNTMDRVSSSKEGESQIKATQTQIQAGADNLEFLGMSQTQIAELAHTRKPTRNIEIRAPVSGLVLARNAFAGLRFDRGTELYRIAELDHIWILADVFDNEAEYFQPGAMARVMLKTQDKTLMAKVSDAVPRFDPNSRTLKVRLEAENSDLVLRPDMFVDVELALEYPATLTVPRDAIMDCGRQKTVFVQTGNGVFEPHAIETGWRSNDRVQVKSGLTPGEIIVISGGFLLDSESRMKLAATATLPAPSAASSSEMPSGLAAPPQHDARRKPANKPGVDTAKDPVCGMVVDKVKAEAANRFAESGGIAVYFCSEGCKEQYVKNPAKFAAGGKGAPSVAKAE